MKIHHLGYAVKNLNLALRNFQKLGYNKLHPQVIDKQRKVVIQFIQKDGYRLELVSPLGRQSPLGNILKKIGPTAYHLGYEVKNINQKISQLRRNKFFLLEKSSSAPAMLGKKVAFLFNKEIGLIELVEK